MIKELECPNFIGKKTLKIKFQDGVNIITGSNSCGKSKLLSTIMDVSQDKITFISLEEILSCYYDGAETYNPLRELHLLEKPDYLKLVDTYNNISTESNMLTSIHGNILFNKLNPVPNIVINKLNNNSSLGEFTLLYVISTILLEKADIILLDGIDAVLHKDVQINLLDNLVALTSPETQIIITSHSPSLLISGWDSYVINLLNCLHDMNEDDYVAPTEEDKELGRQATYDDMVAQVLEEVGKGCPGFIRVTAVDTGIEYISISNIISFEEKKNFTEIIVNPGFSCPPYETHKVKESADEIAAMITNNKEII